MILGALVGAGADPHLLVEQLALLDLVDARIEVPVDGKLRRGIAEHG